MKKGIVYLLTNPCLEGWVKIGMTAKDDIADRLRELNSSTSIPLSFRVYAEYHVDNPTEVEQSIHRLIDLVDNDLRAREYDDNQRIIRQREFFQISSLSAYRFFKEVARLRGDSDNLILVAPSEEEMEEQEIADRKQGRKWNEGMFFESVAEHDASRVDGITNLYEFSKEIGQIRWGTGSIWGTFSVTVPELGTHPLYLVGHGGNLQLHIGWFSDNPKLEEGLRDLAALLLGTAEPSRQSPRIRYTEWEPKLNEFKQAISELIATCRN